MAYDRNFKEEGSDKIGKFLQNNSVVSGRYIFHTFSDAPWNVCCKFADFVFGNWLVKDINPSKELKNALENLWSTARGEYSLDDALYITLWKLSNSRVTYRELSDKFHVAKGTAHTIFLKTVRAICKLTNEIRWPSVSQQQEIMEHFQTSRVNTFPFVVGCLDETHFKINTPKTDAISYCDRKGNHSIIMQVYVYMGNRKLF